MAFAASLAELHAEASCPLCLDYLRDPVTIACGHNFCLQCIQQCWEDLQHILPCPVCLHHCPDRNFRRNTQLCHVTGFVRQLPGARSKRKLQEEKLRVFFKKRRELFSHYRLKRRLFKKTE